MKGSILSRKENAIKGADLSKEGSSVLDMSNVKCLGDIQVGMYNTEPGA